MGHFVERVFTSLGPGSLRRCHPQIASVASAKSEVVRLLQKAMEERGWEDGKYLIDGFPRRGEREFLRSSGGGGDPPGFQ